MKKSELLARIVALEAEVSRLKTQQLGPVLYPFSPAPTVVPQLPWTAPWPVTSDRVTVTCTDMADALRRGAISNGIHWS